MRGTYQHGVYELLNKVQSMHPLILVDRTGLLETLSTIQLDYVEAPGFIERFGKQIERFTAVRPALQRA